MLRLLLIPLLLIPACGDGATPQAVVDFLLQDVNPNSGTTGQDLSPRDYLGRVAVWYFGSAT